MISRLITILVFLVGSSFVLQAGTVLEGGTSHVQHLPQLPKALRPGNKADDKEDFSRAGKWFEIPSWLAGRWSVISDYQMSKIDGDSRESDENPVRIVHKEILTLGFQKDATGNIWTTAASIKPYVSNEAGTRNIKSHIVSSLKIEDPRQVKIVGVEQVVKCDPETGIIVDTERKHVISNIILLDDGVIVISRDEQSYDPDGLPKDQSKHVVTCKRVSRFRIVDRLDNYDALTSFCRYLTDVGSLSLIPEKKGNH